VFVRKVSFTASSLISTESSGGFVAMNSLELLGHTVKHCSTSDSLALGIKDGPAVGIGEIADGPSVTGSFVSKIEGCAVGGRRTIRIGARVGAGVVGSPGATSPSNSESTEPGTGAITSGVPGKAVVLLKSTDTDIAVLSLRSTDADIAGNHGRQRKKRCVASLFYGDGFSVVVW
jgi:hypothetical protein